MTTKEKIAVMQAFDEGKPIEYKLATDSDTDWVLNSDPQWDWEKCIYRIKPEPKLRPYATPEEFLQAMKEHGPCIRLGVKQYYIPKMIDDNKGIVYADRFRSYFVEYKDLPGQMVWQDNTPCGILEP